MANKDNHFIMLLSIVSSLILCLYICMPAYSQQRSVYPTVTKFVGSKDFDKYRSLAVLPFADAPNASQSGQVAQGIAGTMFAKAGFQVVERSRLYSVLDEQKLMSSGLINENQSVRLGKLLGANAVVVGMVEQYQTISRHTDPVYETHYPCEKDPAACERDLGLLGAMQGYQAAAELAKELRKPQYILKQGQQWMESYASVSLRVIDVETGLVIYSAAGHYEKGHTNPPQQLLEFILQSIVNEWVGS